MPYTYVTLFGVLTPVPALSLLLDLERRNLDVRADADQDSLWLTPLDALTETDLPTGRCRSRAPCSRPVAAQGVVHPVGNPSPQPPTAAAAHARPQPTCSAAPGTNRAWSENCSQVLQSRDMVEHV